MADGGSLATLLYAFDNVTLRQIVHTSVGGNSRSRSLLQLFRNNAVELGAAHVALRDSGSSIVVATDRALTFSGSPSAAIAPGESRRATAIAFDVPQLGDLSVSIELPESTAA